MGRGAFKGRGAVSNPQGRFEQVAREAVEDGWFPDPEDAPGRPATTVTEERARSIVSRNQSPDIPFDASINPYRGCEHGCVYCYARPSHAFIDLSPGLDFETKLYAKTNAAELLRATLSKRGYRPTPINLGANTDPYQPIDKRYRVTRELLEVLAEARHSCTIITKSAMVERDLDLLTAMARDGLVAVLVSVTSLDNRLSAKLEPRASAPARRLRAIATLAAAGVPVGVLVSPVIPAVTDIHLEEILAQAAAAGATRASYALLRLPHEVAPLFREWLDEHLPERASHVMSLVQQMRGGRDNDSRFGVRLRGEGVFADLIARRFKVAVRRHGLNQGEGFGLREDLFRAPDGQGELF
ncbi:PA0069 family radical SAM protein [Thioalkalivibrio sp. XN279]|uniref:PA0069 family radical SAM protein n=1 Tax=Thioalkalivibrio sp. XN279 TaxID=2714953 RepID=UPI00140A0414|nr:PA0069 family radical SAM protein [Thioalkalivibrio sp. XN279]